MSKEKQPLVSIVMPVYNSAETVESVIDRVLSQKYKNFELIIVNDGSSDGTAKILSKYQDKRIRTISQANSGAASARNAGIEIATGEYLMFIDSDDNFADDFIVRMVDAITSNKADIAICGHDGYGTREVLPQKTGIVENDLPNHITSSILRNGLLFALWNKIYRMNIVRKHHLRLQTGVSYGEDLIFNLSYFRHVKRIYYLRESLYEYILRPTGLSAKTASNMGYRYQMLEALKNYLGDSIKRPQIAVKFKLIKLRWHISTRKNKFKQRLRK